MNLVAGLFVLELTPLLTSKPGFLLLARLTEWIFSRLQYQISIR